MAHRQSPRNLIVPALAAAVIRLFCGNQAFGAQDRGPESATKIAPQGSKSGSLACEMALRGEPQTWLPYCFAFEICERPELPEALRTEIFVTLSWLERVTGLSQALKESLASALRQTGATHLVELGSGSGSNIASVADVLTPGSTVLLTDKFPQTEVWNSLSAVDPRLQGHPGSVSFDTFQAELPREYLKGNLIVTIAAFHHLDARQARRFLEQVAAVEANLLVVEPLERSTFNVFLGAGGGVLSLAAPLLAQSGRTVTDRLRAAILHWFVPAVPYVISQDGVVSALRQRTGTEWNALTEGLPFERIQKSGMGPLRNFNAQLLLYKPPRQVQGPQDVLGASEDLKPL